MLFVLIQIGIALQPEGAFDEGMHNVLTYAQVMLTVICVIGWWFLFSPTRRSTCLLIGVPVVVAIVGWIYSIRKIDFGGAMDFRIEYAWEESAQERLKEHLQNAPTADVAVIEDSEISVEDMPAYRGVNRDGVVSGPQITTNWETHPPQELWRHPIGGGYSSFAVHGRQLLTMEQRGEDEAVVCYDTETGLEFWNHAYKAHFQEAMGGPGPRSTPTIHDGAVYSFGAFGDLFKLDLKTGEVIWHVNVLQQFRTPNTMWAMTSSPLIYQQSVIVNIGGVNEEGQQKPKPGGGLVAYELESGDLIWSGAALPEPDRERTEFDTGGRAVDGLQGLSVPGYSSPMIANIAGQEVLLNFDGTAFRGHDPTSGEQLWAYPFKAGDHISVAQPIVFDDDRVLISAGYSKGSVMLKISKSGDGWSFEEVWEKPSNRLRSKFSSPVLYEGYIYGLDEGVMVCINPADGSRQWKGRREGLRGRYGHGQILLNNGKIIVLCETGQLVLIDPNPNELTVLGTIQALDESIKTWNPHAMAYGKVFVRNAEEVACFDLRDPSTISSIQETNSAEQSSLDPNDDLSRQDL